MILNKGFYKTKGFLDSFFRYFYALSLGLLRWSRRSISNNGLVFSRGLQLTVDSSGDLSCYGCQLCEQVCPTRCLSTSLSRPLGVEQKPQSFIWKKSECLYCGLCEEACPIDALRMADWKVEERNTIESTEIDLIGLVDPADALVSKIDPQKRPSLERVYLKAGWHSSTSQ